MGDASPNLQRLPSEVLALVLEAVCAGSWIRAASIQATCRSFYVILQRNIYSQQLLPLDRAFRLIRINPEKGALIRHLEVTSNIHQASYELNRIALEEVLPLVRYLTHLYWGSTFFRPEIGHQLCELRHLQTLEIGLPANGIPQSFLVWRKVIEHNSIQKFRIYRQSLFVNLDDQQSCLDRKHFLIDLLQVLAKSAHTLDLSSDASSFDEFTFSALSRFERISSLSLPTDKPLWHENESYTHIALEHFLIVNGQLLEELSILNSTPYLVRSTTLATLAEQCPVLRILKLRVDLVSDAATGQALIRAISQQAREVQCLEIGGTGIHWGDPGQESREHGPLVGSSSFSSSELQIHSTDLLTALLRHQPAQAKNKSLTSLILPTPLQRTDAHLISQRLPNLARLTVILDQRAGLHDTLPYLSGLENLAELKVLLARPYAGEEIDLEVEIIHMLCSCLKNGDRPTASPQGWNHLHRIELVTAKRGLEHGLVERRFWRVFEFNRPLLKACVEDGRKSVTMWTYNIRTSTAKDARYAPVRSRTWEVQLQQDVACPDLLLSLKYLEEDIIRINRSSWARDRTRVHWADGFL